MADKDKYADEIMSDDELDNVSGGAHSKEEVIDALGENLKELGPSIQKMIELLTGAK